MPVVERIDNSTIVTGDPSLQTKDFARSRKSFVYLGSWGFINKGLDLVLEAFAAAPDLHVWVCGPIDRRKDVEFLREYRKELFHSPNIHPVGWTNVNSSDFDPLADRCGSLIFPSCTEGMSGSVLDAMARGLIPVVTPECGVDVSGFGLTINPGTVESVLKAIHAVAEASPDDCRRMAVAAHRQAITRYTLDAFSRNIERAIGSVVEQFVARQTAAPSTLICEPA